MFKGATSLALCVVCICIALCCVCMGVWVDGCVYVWCTTSGKRRNGEKHAKCVKSSFRLSLSLPLLFIHFFDAILHPLPGTEGRRNFSTFLWAKIEGIRAISHYSYKNPTKNLNDEYICKLMEEEGGAFMYLCIINELLMKNGAGLFVQEWNLCWNKILRNNMYIYVENDTVGKPFHSIGRKGGGGGRLHKYIK